MGYAIVDRQVARIFEAAVKAFDSLGCEMDEAHPPAGDPREWFSTQVGSAEAGQLYDLLPKWGDKLDRGLRAFVERSKDIPARDYVKARMALIDYASKLVTFFEKYDLLLTPVLAVPPFSADDYGVNEINGQKVGPIAWMPFTYPFNISGQPASSVPCGFTDDGLPIGMQIVGRKYEEALVLKASAAFEQAQPWADKYPPID
jgi:aspartyl-tRNA(Asn)/glutamyl-tRNA(Gln) amidotransferase subunit A